MNAVVLDLLVVKPHGSGCVGAAGTDGGVLVGGAHTWSKADTRPATERGSGDWGVGQSAPWCAWQPAHAYHHARSAWGRRGSPRGGGFYPWQSAGWTRGCSPESARAERSRASCSICLRR